MSACSVKKPDLKPRGTSVTTVLGPGPSSWAQAFLAPLPIAFLRVTTTPKKWLSMGRVMGLLCVPVGTQGCVSTLHGPAVRGLSRPGGQGLSSSVQQCPSGREGWPHTAARSLGREAALGCPRHGGSS